LINTVGQANDSDVKYFVGERGNPVELTVNEDETDDDIRRVTRILEESLREERERP
jgi:hypothetical protein